jgi:hypothetical protein
MEGLGGMDKALVVEAFSSFPFLSRTIPLIDEVSTLVSHAYRHVLPSPHAPRASIMQANPDPSASRLSSSLERPHLPDSPIQLAYHQTLPREGGLSQGPGFIPNVAFMGMHLPLSDRYRPNVSKSTHTKPHRAYLSQATLPLHYNRVHALIRRERTVSAIHGRECALQG